MVAPGPEEHDTLHINLDKLERARVELKMPVGELEVRGGSQGLVEGDFSYNVTAWKPNVRYHPTGSVGDLSIEQPGPTATRGGAKNKWRLRFNKTVPLDFRVEVGAGEAELELGSLILRSVDLQMGAGALRMDLRGSPTADYSVHVRGGVGEAIIYLPKDVGVSAEASGGIGEISVSGLRKMGDRYVNDAYDRSGARIRLDIKGGVGTIRLIAD